MNRSENNIMWDTICDIFSNSPTDRTKSEVMKRLDSYKVNKGKEVEYNFSHDNMGLKLCWLHRFDKKNKKLVPSFGNHVIHPIRFITFLHMKYPIFFFLQIITFLDMIVRHGIIRSKTKAGNYHTSGLLLDYYHAYSYKNRITMYVLTKLMKTMFKNWEEVFTKYHGNPEHYNYKVLRAFRTRKENV